MSVPSLHRWLTWEPQGSAEVGKFRPIARKEPTKPSEPSSDRSSVGFEGGSSGKKQNFESDIEGGELKRRWEQRWPDKPFETLDAESGQWAIEMLNKAGTRIVWVNGERGLAVWPEQDGSEYRLALKLLKLDSHEIHSRDNPEIERLIAGQYPRQRG